MKVPHDTGKISQIGYEIATDTFGKIPMNHEGIIYVQVFIDTASRRVWIYGMTAKSEFPDVLEEFLLDFKTEHPNGKSVIHVTRSNKMASAK